MIGPQDGIRALESIRDNPDVTDSDKSLAQGLEALIWLLLSEQKKIEELQAVLHGVSRIVDRLKVELIEDHNRDIEAISTSLAAMEDLVASMRRVT